ncbi:YitT family protein [Demequina activiva]|uniref:Membrane protein n=1 Tax=Demequina activiva TaxID=1582364 RepID=A0A919UG71_9MICO|nr:YitT family protein [Demequina activiva]GIG54537.1 membrane protein [Demequina activiva]
MSVVDPPIAEKHAVWEDALALPFGAFLLSFGLFLLSEIGGVSGGLAGVAILGSYWTGFGFGVIFFVVNLPFYWLAVRRMGWAFTLKTLITVSLISLFTAVHGLYLDVSEIAPLYAVIFAGLVIGVGMLMVFRHGASAGGFGILAAYLQERHGIRAGYVQGALDLIVVIASLALVPLDILAYSIVGAVLLNLVLAINHRPGRYFG